MKTICKRDYKETDDILGCREPRIGTSLQHPPPPKHRLQSVQQVIRQQAIPGLPKNKAPQCSTYPAKGPKAIVVHGIPCPTSIAETIKDARRTGSEGIFRARLLLGVRRMAGKATSSVVIFTNLVFVELEDRIKSEVSGFWRNRIILKEDGSGRFLGFSIACYTVAMFLSGLHRCT